MHPFLHGIVALLNLSTVGVAPAESASAPVRSAYEETFVASADTMNGDWAETKLKAGVGTSRLARAEDYTVPVTADEEIQPPVITSLSDADPTTEVVWDPDSGTDFVDTSSEPLAVWAETKLYPPPPPPVPVAPAPARRVTPPARGTTPARTPAKPSPNSRPGGTDETPHSNSGAIALTVPGGAAHKFPWGQCTYYVASRRKIVFRGNAKEWPRNAKAAGYRTGQTPVVGAVAVTRESWYGHVVYVEKVNGDGSFTFSEMNYAGLGVVTRRTMKTSDSRFVTFIY